MPRKQNTQLITKKAKTPPTAKFAVAIGEEQRFHPKETASTESYPDWVQQALKSLESPADPPSDLLGAMTRLTQQRSALTAATELANHFGYGSVVVSNEGYVVRPRIGLSRGREGGSQRWERMGPVLEAIDD